MFSCITLWYLTISENVEEKEESYTSAASPVSDDASFVSTATVKEKAPVVMRTPPTGSPSISPKKQTTSPTVKVSKSSVSEFTGTGSARSEHAQSPTSTTGYAQTGLTSAEVVSDRIAGNSETVNIDLTESSEMEVEQSQVVSQSEKHGKEIFKDYEEINPLGELDEEGEIEEEVEEMEVVAEENEALAKPLTVSPSGKRTEVSEVKVEIKVEQEVFDGPPAPARLLKPPRIPSAKLEVTFYLYLLYTC